MGTYYIYDEETVRGPYEIGQLVSMWEYGAITANAQYFDDLAQEWHPVVVLLKATEAQPPPQRPGPTLNKLPAISVANVLKPIPAAKQAALPAEILSNPESRSYHHLFVVACILVALACGVALIPFHGFASWLIVLPLTLATFILGIVLFAGGGIMRGWIVLLGTIILVPLCVLLASFRSLIDTTGAAGNAVAPVASNHYPIKDKARKPGDSKTRAQPATLLNQEGRSSIKVQDRDVQPASGALKDLPLAEAQGSPGVIAANPSSGMRSESAPDAPASAASAPLQQQIDDSGFPTSVSSSANSSKTFDEIMKDNDNWAAQGMRHSVSEDAIDLESSLPGGPASAELTRLLQDYVEYDSSWFPMFDRLTSDTQAQKEQQYSLKMTHNQLKAAKVLNEYIRTIDGETFYVYDLNAKVTVYLVNLPAYKGAKDRFTVKVTKRGSRWYMEPAQN